MKIILRKIKINVLIYKFKMKLINKMIQKKIWPLKIFLQK